MVADLSDTQRHGLSWENATLTPKSEKSEPNKVHFLLADHHAISDVLDSINGRRSSLLSKRVKIPKHLLLHSKRCTDWGGSPHSLTSGLRKFNFCPQSICPPRVTHMSPFFIQAVTPRLLWRPCLLVGLPCSCGARHSQLIMNSFHSFLLHRTQLEWGGALALRSCASPFSRTISWSSRSECCVHRV
jgi:hypothetical protein